MPLKLPPYGTTEVCLLLFIIIIQLQLVNK